MKSQIGSCNQVLRVHDLPLVFEQLNGNRGRASENFIAVWSPRMEKTETYEH